jgi:hypothetical protein
MRNPLLRFLLGHLLQGLVGALIFTAMVLASDLGGLRTLMLASTDGLLALGLLVFGLSVTFGGVAMGVAVMRGRI